MTGDRLAGPGPPTPLLAERDDAEPTVFRLGTAVTCAISGRHRPDGFYTLDRMLQAFTRTGGTAACCGTVWTPAA